MYPWLLSSLFINCFSDIYKEAFENAKCAEEKKFHGRFDSLMVELSNSLEKLLQNGVNHSYSNTPCKWSENC